MHMKMLSLRIAWAEPNRTSAWLFKFYTILPNEWSLSHPPCSSSSNTSARNHVRMSAHRRQHTMRQIVFETSQGDWQWIALLNYGKRFLFGLSPDFCSVCSIRFVRWPAMNLEVRSFLVSFLPHGGYSHLSLLCSSLCYFSVHYKEHGTTWLLSCRQRPNFRSEILTCVRLFLLDCVVELTWVSLCHVLQ